MNLMNLMRKYIGILSLAVILMTGCGQEGFYREGYFYVKSSPEGYQVCLDSKDVNGTVHTAIIWSGLSVESATRDAQTLNNHLIDPTVAK